MITADGRTPVEVEAALVSTRDRRDGSWTWRGRVVPINGSSLLTFLRADEIQLRVAGLPNPCIIATLGEANSEVEGLGPPTF
jgi:hypothetical protein